MFIKIQYLGTGAAEGVPAVFCHCATCEEVRRRGGREIHTRSQLLIDGIFGIEFPPDAYFHSVRDNADLSAIRYLLITHSHMDHFYAHDFILRGYKYSTGIVSPTLDIYGNAEVGKVYAECTRREMKEEVGDAITFHELSPYTPVTFGGYTVTPLRAQHTAAECAFVYLIEKDGKAYLHLTDTGRLYREVYDYLAAHEKKIDLVCFDCTLLFTTKGDVGRHMGIEDNMVVKRELEKIGAVNESTRYLITHFSHNSAPLSENLSLIEDTYGVTAAYDGITVEL